MDSLAKKELAKVQAILLPVVAKAANDAAPEVREANMGVLVSFAIKAGNMNLLDKVSISWVEQPRYELVINIYWCRNCL